MNGQGSEGDFPGPRLKSQFRGPDFGLLVINISGNTHKQNDRRYYERVGASRGQLDTL